MPKINRRLAVVIGINQYQHGISPLQSAVSDAKEIARLLEEDHGYIVWRFLDAQATLNALLDFLQTTLPQKIETEDTVLFYFAGHGIALNSDEGPQGYLIPQDAQLGNSSSYLPMPELQGALLALPCRHFLAILDCCFAGAFRWASTRDLLSAPEVIHKERFDRFIESPAWQAITSAAHDQKALDLLTLTDHRGRTVNNHSPFAAALIEALEGQADSSPPAQNGKPAGDGVITATELYLYLRDRVELLTEDRRQRQTPGLWALDKHDKGEYIFLTPGHELNLPPAPPLDVTQNPYRGLESFDEDSAHLFFGRSATIENLYPFVREHPLTVVLGASGSGKSSLVKAGLIPHIKTLESDLAFWTILSPLRPGDSPFNALNNTLQHARLPQFSQPNSPSEGECQRLLQNLTAWIKHNSNTYLLLVIDQSEELFTLCPSSQLREQFLHFIARAIAIAPQQVRILLTLRSDFEPQFRETALEPYWQDGRFVISPMTREELRDAIEQPASQRVMYFEPPSLVDRLIDEVMQMPGALPLLSFTLSELYLKYLQKVREGNRDKRAITQEDYEELGGVARSLTQRADAEYDALVKEDQDCGQTIRHLMLRAIAVSGGELTRRQVPLTELEYPEPKNTQVQRIIDRLSAARLLVGGIDAKGYPYIEPAHDALVRGWQKLLAWEREEQETLILQRRLTPAAQEWSEKGKNLYLWHANPRLDLLRQVRRSEDNWLNQTEDEFVRRSVWRKRRNRIIRWGIAAGVFVALGSLTIFSLISKNQADLRAEASQIKDTLSVNPLQGLVLAIEATGKSQSLFKHFLHSEFDRVQYGLLTAIETPKFNNMFLGHEGEVNWVAVSPDGTKVVSGGWDGVVRLWDSEGNLMVKPFPGHEDAITAVAFSPDGKTIVSASWDGTMRLWDLQGNAIGKPFAGHENVVTSAVFSPDGKTIVSASQDQTIRLWDLEGNPLGKPFAGHEDAVTSVAFSPDGKTIASGSWDATVRLWDLEGNPLGKPFRGHREEITTVAFSPDGKTIASGSYDETVKLWDLEGNLISESFQGHQDKVYGVAFSPDGQSIISASLDKTLRLWDLEGNLIGEPFRGHEDSVNAVAFSSDGEHIVSGSDDGVVGLWKTQSNSVFRGHRAEVLAIAFSPDSNLLASGSADRTVRLWNLKGNTLLVYEGHENAVSSVAFSPDGSILASGSEDKTIRLWDLKGNPVGKPFQGHKDTIAAIAFSPDGKIVASASLDQTIRLWDLGGNPIGEPFRGHEDIITSVAFSPDGKTIVSGSDDKTIRLWDLEGNSIGEPFENPHPEHDYEITSVAFSPNGDSIISGSAGQALHLWDLEGNVLFVYEGHGNEVLSVTFSPDGEHVASGGKDDTVRLWDAESDAIKIFRGHQDDVFAVAFSPNGKIIASSSHDRTIRLWQGGDWRTWLKKACHNPIVERPGRLDRLPNWKSWEETTQKARKTCQKYVWNQQH
ncbi:caspase family protein [Lusitaniella coriacea LEGE 07157]|uniref:Caspase family protein n=1 Tax=Lusitaniella coriacea LEGE 07157 TaxID=945747 RepID=A0A8J7JF56_9CYAN|nr:caspase family protein [Lusitaniella coriacea]MBE9119110.1 caspase family protein [Lusitaniella coriacea LEGE 07157]